MNKMEYLSKLEHLLKKQFSTREVNDIIRDYAEYFEEGRRQNKTDEEISTGLGSPETVAKQLFEENNMSSEDFAYTVKKSIDKGKRSLSGFGKFFKAILILLGVLIFGPVGFAVLIAFCALIAGLIALCAGMLTVPLALFAVSIVCLIIASMVFGFVSIPIGILVLVVAIAICSLGVSIGCLVLLFAGFTLGLCKKTILWIGRFIKQQNNSPKEDNINE